MKHIILLSGDPRCATQITQWSKELKDETAVEVFTDLESFHLFISPPVDEKTQTEGEIAALQISEDKKESLYNQALIKEEGINLIVIDQELIRNENPITFIQELQEKLKQPIFKKTENPTRYFLLSFETTSAAIESLVSSSLDDLILKPIDHQLFLQKLAMALSDTQSAAGEFLYSQPVEASVYMAKSAVIDEISDFGVGIRSRQKMKDGVAVRIYSKIFGERQASSLLAKSYKTIAHPKHPDSFLVYYSYFGITAQQLTKIRRDAQPKQKHGPGRRPLSSVEVDIFKKNKKHIAVIAFKEDLRTDIRQALEANFINVVVHPFPSIASFAKELGVGTKTETPPAPEVVTPVIEENAQKHEELKFAFAGGQFNFTINHQDEVLSVQTKNVSFFEIENEKLIADGRHWLKFIHPEDLEEVVEFLNYIKNNGRGQIFVRFIGPQQEIHYIRLLGQEILGVVPPQIRILMSETLGEDGLKLWKSYHPTNELKLEAEHVACIIIDASGIIETVETWASQFKGFLETAKVISSEKKVPVLVLLPEKSLAKLEELKLTFFSDVILTPHDRKLLIEKVNLNCSGLCNEYGLMVTTFEPASAEVKVAQQVQMEMASEFGIKIRATKPLREGVFLRFFSPLFLDENYEGILARMFSAQQDEKNKSEYHNIFSFYGISDSFLKHIRKWIREAHIAQKDTKD